MTKSEIKFLCEKNKEIMFLPQTFFDFLIPISLENYVVMDLIYFKLKILLDQLIV